MDKSRISFELSEIVGISTAVDGLGNIWLQAPDGTRTAPNATDLLNAYKAEGLRSIRSEAQLRIVQAHPEWRQRSAALGVYPQSFVDQMQADIAAIVSASNAAEDAVTVASTIADVEAVTPAWP